MPLCEIVYLDNSSTTKPCDKAVNAVHKALCADWGNPSSLHRLGFEAEMCINDVRQTIADILHCRSDEIYFTGSGTEGNNTAIIGAALARSKRGKKIVTTSVEHPSVLEAFKRLEESGFEVVYLKPDITGKISEDSITAAIDNTTVLVSIMLVNNETGAIMPVLAAAKAIKQKGAPALLHCDAVQAFGKMPIDVAKLGVDILTGSGHKIHAPKGIGFLYVKKGVTIKPLIVGGGQEKGMRSGTESVPLICGLGGAIGELPNIKESLDKQKHLCTYAKEKLCQTGLVTVNSPEDALPYVLNISLIGYRSETLLHFLENKNIFVSSGSACSKGQGSYVLREMGLDRKRVDSAIRISFSRFNTTDDIDRLAKALSEAATVLRKAN